MCCKCLKLSLETQLYDICCWKTAVLKFKEKLMALDFDEDSKIVSNRGMLCDDLFNVAGFGYLF